MTTISKQIEELENQERQVLKEKDGAVDIILDIGLAKIKAKLKTLKSDLQLFNEFVEKLKLETCIDKFEENPINRCSTYGGNNWECSICTIIDKLKAEVIG